MSIERQDFVLQSYLKTKEWARVKKIADEFQKQLNKPRLLAELKSRNVPGASSRAIQDLFKKEAEKLGFKHEAEKLFHAEYALALRPDYYKALGKTGILLEVERGKSIDNNMDLLDFWKTHICPEAHYLFLLVPVELKQSSSASTKKVFQSVKKRLEPFFETRNQTNVRGTCLFGY